MKKIVAIIFIAVIVVGGAYFYETNNAETKDSISVNDVLTVSPQQVVGTVTVDRVVLDKPGFVSVREVIDGKMGQILEVSKYLEAGEYTALEIELYDVPDEGVEPVVVLHEDNGDKGFNPAWDDVVLINEQVVAIYTSTGEFVETSILKPSLSSNVDTGAVATIRYTDNGFVPNITEITEGETVLFVNDSSKPMWVASDPHPSHLILSTFDQFGTVANGESYSYTFDKAGEWKYHDHINPSLLGTVLVKEKSSVKKNDAGYYSVDSTEFEKITLEEDVQVVNVHIPYGGEIAETDDFIPFNDISNNLNKLPEDKNTKIALYCRSGGMSADASRQLVELGYTNVYDLTGGMNAYKKSGREVLNKK